MLSPNLGASYGEDVGAIYLDAELRVLSRIAAAIAAGMEADDWETATLARIQRVRAEVVAELNATNPAAAAAMLEALQDAYSQGGLSLLEDVGDLLDPLDADPTARVAAVQAVAADLAQGVTDATPGILRAVDDVFREVVGRVTASTLTGAEFRKDAAQRALTELAGRGLQAVGTARGSMSLPDYVTMAVRTATARAALQGHEDAMQANGLDLCTINPGPRVCGVCDPWTRLVLSRGGTPTGTVEVKSLTGPGTLRIRVAGTLSEARAAGWGHPNCRCALRTYLPGATRAESLKRPAWDREGYEAQQRQRSLERRIREAKQRDAVAITPEAQARARQGVREGQAAMRAHLDAHPYLKRQSRREQAGRVL